MADAPFSGGRKSGVGARTRTGGDVGLALVGSIGSLPPG